MDKKEVLTSCICKRCPSYAECDETIGYCLARTGKSKCIVKEKGCLCPACPVASKEGLKHVFYCTRKSEKEQGKK
jgi:hypothetical protein